ncbi:MAG TPA: protein phosphatase 2C domain-containing protein [Candidatus Baltobacteraceae bacterium]|jgi:PPM family protein phosphatase|nr:protein phosphatase 2C domain-containing protein [Candidatus Baltobacteraceae bacterium]
MMDVEFAQLSDLGRVRQGNEDYLGYVTADAPERARSHGWFFALADGVGGHDLGEVASKTAVESVLEGFRKSGANELHPALLASLVRAANTRVLEAGHAANPSGSRMATTIVACALRHDRATVAHVGDSRCYLIRGGQANLLTRDHTLAGEHVRLGLISAAEAGSAETRHLLSRSLGSALTVNVDVSEHQVLVGDILLLCSDGLHGSVQGSEMAAVAGNSEELPKAAQRLVDIANQRDGSDNISLQIIRVKGVERVGMYRGRPYRLP